MSVALCDLGVGVGGRHEKGKEGREIGGGGKWGGVVSEERREDGSKWVSEQGAGS